MNILLVEDNRSLSKLISKKIEYNLGYQVTCAFSLKETIQHLRSKQHFDYALLDLNLPDAPDGQVVDFVLSKKIPTMVLTGNIDKQIREEISQKDIIDYVYKGSLDDVNYIISNLETINKHKGTKILVVDDSITMRKQIQSILSSQLYTVFVAAHGEEALNILNDHRDIKLVLTDYQMPVIDGLELTKTIRKNYDKNHIAIIAISGMNDTDVAVKFLKFGATDFIKKPFTREELICRVSNTIESITNIQTITNLANTDYLTGAYNRRYFFDTVKEYYEEALEIQEPLAIALIDIDFFKKVNDTHGHDAGDIAIQHLSNLLRANTKGSDVVSRFGGEEFCIALKNIDLDEATSFFEKLRHKISTSSIKINEELELSITVSIGVATELQDSLDEMINLADLALYRAKNGGRDRIEFN